MAATQTKPAPAQAKAPSVTIICLPDQTGSGLRTSEPRRKTIRKADGTAYQISIAPGQLVVLSAEEAEYLAPEIAAGNFNAVEITRDLQAIHHGKNAAK